MRIRCLGTGGSAAATGAEDDSTPPAESNPAEPQAEGGGSS